MLPKILSSDTQRLPRSEFCADGAPSGDFGARLRKGSFWQTNGLGLLYPDQLGNSPGRSARRSCLAGTQVTP
jgi:hypothetical protein